MSKMMSNMGSMQMESSSSKMSSSLSFLLLLLLLDDEQQHVLDAWRRQRRDVSASDAWNGDARVPLHARHDHRGDALGSFHPSTCLRDPLHCHLPNVTANPQGGSQRGLQGALCH